jgi:hypothetical protein
MRDVKRLWRCDESVLQTRLRELLRSGSAALPSKLWVFEFQAAFPDGFRRQANHRFLFLGSCQVICREKEVVHVRDFTGGKPFYADWTLWCGWLLSAARVMRPACSPRQKVNHRRKVDRVSTNEQRHAAHSEFLSSPEMVERDVGQ